MDKFLSQIQHESWPNDAGTSNIFLMCTSTPQQASYIHQTGNQRHKFSRNHVKHVPIQPQQPNYTIHISQAIIKCRAQTQTAEFSEAGETTDRDGNDDQ
jgi:hypothetical protein